VGCDFVIVIGKRAMEKKNTTSYEIYITKEELVNFLKEHKGKECFYMCW